MNGIHVRGRWGTGLPRHHREIPLKAPLLAAGMVYSTFDFLLYLVITNSGLKINPNKISQFTFLISILASIIGSATFGHPRLLPHTFVGINPISTSLSISCKFLYF